MNFFKDLREKTLTAAEKKKREEIAKAMEKDDPGMDMSKKMAIATATAKKVAEEVQLDEDMKSAAKEMRDYANKHGGIDKADFHKAAKHMEAGDHKAIHKHVNSLDSEPRDKILTTLHKHGNDIKRYGYSTEEVEQVDELNRSTLSSYMSKASDARKHKDLSTAKVDKRYSGVAKAAKKLDKMEEVEESSQYKTVNGEKMRWDNVKNMWMPVHNTFEGAYKNQDIDDKEMEANPGMRSPRKAAPPFDGPYRKKSSAVASKHGEGPSTAKHLAKMGLKQFMNKSK